MENLEVPDDLMPFQMEPFNGDKFIQMKMARFAIDFPDAVVIETGTCIASSTVFLAKHFKKVYTIENSSRFYAYSIKRVGDAGLTNVELILGGSERVLPLLLFKEDLPKDVVFFLDAHWGNFCPLESELTAILLAEIENPIIAIHDWKVAGSDLGYDSYNGQDFDLEWIGFYLNNIYPNGFKYETNNDQESMGAKRGIIYISSADPA